jgi:hypothetical protein
LANQRHATVGVDGDDGDSTGVAGDIALRTRPIGPLNGVDPEADVPTLVESPRVDDPLNEIGPGGILRGRLRVVGSLGGQAATAAMSGASVMPVSPSKT